MRRSRQVGKARQVGKGGLLYKGFFFLDFFSFASKDHLSVGKIQHHTSMHDSHLHWDSSIS